MSNSTRNLFQIVGQADRYHQFRPRYHSIPFGWILAEKKGKYQKALDVACGTGHSSQALKIIADDIIGIDYSEEMLRVAKSSSTIPCILGDAKDLPFKDNAFDFINVSMGFHWLDQDEFLEEAKRVLSPTGQVCINSITFCGRISENEEKQEKHSILFKDYLPQAKRKKGYPNKEILYRHQLSLDRHLQFSKHCTLGSSEFINLVMTWSNYQILSSTEKEKVEQIMQDIYGDIFQGEKLPLKFNGKASLYSFRVQD